MTNQLFSNLFQFCPSTVAFGVRQLVFLLVSTYELWMDGHLSLFILRICVHAISFSFSEPYSLAISCPFLTSNSALLTLSEYLINSKLVTWYKTADVLLHVGVLFSLGADVQLNPPLQVVLDVQAGGPRQIHAAISQRGDVTAARSTKVHRQKGSPV